MCFARRYCAGFYLAAQTVRSLRAAAIGPNIAPARAEVEARPSARGKFIFVGGDKLYVRGVTYGTFRPDEDGHEYPAAAVVERDFAHMAACGVNAVRVYTVPTRRLLDCACGAELAVIVAVAGETQWCPTVYMQE